MNPEKLFGPPPAWQVVLLLVVIFLLGVASGVLARPGDGLTCVRDYTGTCAEPEKPKDPCGEKK